MASNDITKFVDGNGDEFNFRDPSKEAVANKVTSIRASSSASDDKYPSEKAVASAIEALDVSSVGGAGKYISAISETDGKISATATTMDTTPTANSTNAVTSDGIKTALDAKAPSAVTTEAVIANGDKMIISDASDSSKLKRATVAFDGSTTGQFLTKKGTFAPVLEADVNWSGAFRTSKSPTEMFALQNVWFGPKVSAVSVEYSNNRTSDNPTWIDYGCTDNDKLALLSGISNVSLYCGKKIHCHPGYTGNAEYKDLSDENIADQGLRITVSCRSLSNRSTDTDNWVYCYMTRILMYMSTQSAPSSTHCVVEKQTGTQYKANEGWTTLGDYKIQGDTGWNSIPFEGAFGGFWTQESNYSWVVRFTIWADKLNASPNSGQTGCLLINRIAALSNNVWTAAGARPSMQQYGTPYTVSATGKATFGEIAFTARKLKTKLDRTADSTFDGSADQTNIPVTGTLPVGNGGTGKDSVTSGNYLVGNGTSALTEKTPKDVGNDVLTALVAGTDTAFFRDDEVIGSNHSSGATDTTRFVRRPVESLWNYIKGKISSVLGLSTNGYTGNAATATNAGSGGDLADAVSKKHSHSTLTLSKTAQTYDGTHTLALPSSDPYTSARTPTAHTHNTDAADVTDSPGSTVITDSTEFVTTNINGYGDGDKKLYRRNFGSYIWPWIRSKLSSDTSVVVSGTAKEVGGTMVLEDSSDTRIGLISVTTLGETTAVKYECLITVEATAGMGNNGSGIVLLAKGNARGTTAYNHSLSILNINKWNVRDYRPMVWNVSSGNGIVTMFGIWDASNNQLAPFTYSRVTVTKLTASEQNVNWLFTHDNGSWSESSTYLTTFASNVASELLDYSTSNTDKRIRCGWDGPAISKVYPTPIQSTIQQSAYLLSLHTEGYTAFYKEVRAENVTVGNSLKWNGYDLIVGETTSSPADDTLYIF